MPARFFILFFFQLLLIACKENTETSLPKFEVLDGMVHIPSGKTAMGSDGTFQTPYGKKDFPEESPVVEIEVRGFWIDETEVTNAQFAKFVEETGYITYAEKKAVLSQFPKETHAYLPKEPFNQGAIVFSAPEKLQDSLDNPASALQWWRWDSDANWRQPLGKGSNIAGKESHPVVCVNFDDASAYAKWAEKRLPTEAEWEFAARGGLKKKTYVWGNELKLGNQWMANTFHGDFPSHDTGEDGFIGSSPVKSYPPNGYGLYDMAGNAWELCSDFYDPDYRANCKNCDPTGPKTWVNRMTGVRGGGAAHYVTKGGSFLCHISYCMRYRPAARHSQENDSPSNHTGFRCVRDY